MMIGTSGRIAFALGKSSSPLIPGMLMSDKIKMSGRSPASAMRCSAIGADCFNLDEGPVTLAFPASLSEESFEELKAQLDLFLRRQQRRARQRLGEKVIGEVLASKNDEAAN